VDSGGLLLACTKHDGKWKTFVCPAMWKPKWLKWMRPAPARKYCRKREDDGSYAGSVFTVPQLMQHGAIDVTDTEGMGIGHVPLDLWMHGV